MAPLDQESDHAGQLLEDVVLVDRALQILLAAAPAGADPAADHAADHLQVSIAEVRELFVDLDQRIQKRKRKPKKRLIAIEHDEERGAQGGRPKSAPAGFEKDIVELAEQVGFLVPVGEALLVKGAVASPERRIFRRRSSR